MTTSQPPLVSIVINNYNYGRFVGEAIESALNQTYKNVEVIVVDDGSTDESRKVIASFGNRVIPVLKENGGQSSAINEGFAASSGTWIHLLDSDDLFYPNKVQRVSELAAEYPTAGMIAHDLEYCSLDGETLEFSAPYILERKLVDDRQLARRGKLSASLPATSGLSIRRDVLECLVPVPEEIRVGTDNYLKWVILSLFPVLIVPETPARQRIHGQNLYTMVVETAKTKDRFRLATVNAILTFHLKREHPNLSKLAWKQYGRILHSLRSGGTAEARKMEQDIRSRYSVIERNPICYFYVAAAFTKASIEAALGKRQR